ncbi:hypothetical protein B5S28_g1322 [[Candida] boidinii]|nr:hypothetical protein B5S28_g1322 [[Candida] boidinii]
MVDVFNVEIFFVILREALEAVIVCSVLLAFIKQSVGDNKVVYKKLVKQVWVGTALGVFLCIVIGCGFIGAYYSLGKDIWANSEDLWEGIFCMIATVLISLMGIAMLRINKMQAKWRVKIARAIVAKPATNKERFKIGFLMKKYAMFFLPFITCLREGLEAVVFVGGVGMGTPATSFPIPVICGLIAGGLVGVFLYFGGSMVSLQIFLCISTAILYLIGAALFSRGVWFFENYYLTKKTGGDAAENGSGPGTYNVHNTIWHVNCCNPLSDNGWDVFNSLLGWQNTATYGSVLSYNLYWLAIITTLMLMMYEEKIGHLPFCKSLQLKQLNPMYHIKNKKKNELTEEEANKLFRQAEQKLNKDVTSDHPKSSVNVIEGTSTQTIELESFN